MGVPVPYIADPGTALNTNPVSPAPPISIDNISSTYILDNNSLIYKETFNIHPVTGVDSSIQWGDSRTVCDPDDGKPASYTKNISPLINACATASGPSNIVTYNNNIQFTLSKAKDIEGDNLQYLLYLNNNTTPDAVWNVSVDTQYGNIAANFISVDTGSGLRGFQYIYGVPANIDSLSLDNSSSGVGSIPATNFNNSGTSLFKANALDDVNNISGVGYSDGFMVDTT